MWKAVFAAVGAAVGPYIGFFGSRFLAVVSVGPHHRWHDTGMDFWFGVPIGAASLCLLGFWLGSALDKRSRLYDSLQK